MRIRIVTGDARLEAELLDNQPARELAGALPLEGSASRWGDEIYFDCSLDAEAADMRQDMEAGDIGYWIEGAALAIFFGPTPASTGEQPRAAVPVAHVGRVSGDAGILRGVRPGDSIRVERADAG